ncbi:Hpt domain-containing protein [Litoribrevibacter euphylliae]|uniref:Hpt domain-containing protein n=1 Tax=Litoribrevibacter euphylliae TaxID=1834034 RepID=A0ABV7HF02_9GAMM
MSQLHTPSVVENLQKLIGEEKFSVILSSSRASLEGIISELKSAYTDSDHETMRRAAHSIKSSVGNYGADPVSKKAEELEHKYKAQDLGNAASEIEELDGLVQGLLTELETYL